MARPKVLHGLLGGNCSSVRPEEIAGTKGYKTSLGRLEPKRLFRLTANACRLMNRIVRRGMQGENTRTPS
jgi:hypothetical protein